MRVISLILIVLFCSCITKRELSYDRYYNNSGLLILRKDSTFWLQDYSYYSNKGSIMGKYQLNEKGKLCIYELIDRLNLPYAFDEENDLIEDNIFIHTEVNKVTYENIDIYAKKDDIEMLLGSLKEGEKSFKYPFNLGDTLQFVFRYEREEGIIVKLKHDVAVTKRIVIDSVKKKIEINFDIFYFDLKDSSEVEEKCFRIRKNKFY